MKVIISVSLCKLYMQVETLLANYDMRVSRRTSFGKKRQLSREVSSKRQLDSSLQSSKGSEFSDVISSTLSDTMESVHLSKSPDPEVCTYISVRCASLSLILTS